jgi:hypothetical protein
MRHVYRFLGSPFHPGPRTVKFSSTGDPKKKFSSTVNRSRLLPRRRVFQSRQASVGSGPRPLPSLRPTNQRRRLGQSPSLEPRRRRQRSVSSTALDRRGQRKTDPAIKSNGARASSLGPVVVPALSPVRVNSRPPLSFPLHLAM